jgi:RNA recognition motif-containing protein
MGIKLTPSEKFRGFAFITYSDPLIAKKVIEM